MQNAQDLSKILDHALSHLASRIRLSIQTLVHPKHQHVRGFARIPSSFRKKPAMQIIESSSVAGEKLDQTHRFPGLPAPILLVLKRHSEDS